MKVLIVTNIFAPTIGGAAAVPEALATSVPDIISVVAAKAGPDRTESEWATFDQRFQFPVYRVKSFHHRLSPHSSGRLRGMLEFAYNLIWIRPAAIATLHKIVARESADVICINTMNYCYWVPALLKRRYPEIKILFYLHGEEVNDGPNITKLGRLAQTALRAADAVVTVSSFTRQRALNCGVDKRKITVINNGVDIERFFPGPKDPAIEGRFGLQGKNVLLCLARLDERKGQDKLIEAMPQVIASVPDAVLLIVGGGDDEARLREIVMRLRLEKFVHFAGIAQDAEILSYYRTCDVYVMPNRTTQMGDTEGFGLVFLEAGACGKPVIGGRAGGVPDAIIHGETGYLVDGTSSSEIAEACISLLSDSVLAARMGQNGLANAQRNTWSAQATKLITCCENLCSPTT